MTAPLAARIAAICAFVAIVFVAVASVAAGCADTDKPDASDAPSSTTVVLGIYSGRPDPTWELSATQSAELARRIDALSTASGVPPEGGLGYHGFTVVLRLAGETDRTLVAYRGTVAPPVTGASPGTGAPDYLEDPERSIERFLLATGRSRLAAPEIAEVEASFDDG